MRLAGGSPQADLRPGRLQTDICMCICVEPERMPPRTTTMFVGFQTEIHVKPRASPQAELRPGRFPTSRTTYDQEAPHKQNYNQGAYVPTTREPMYPDRILTGACAPRYPWFFVGFWVFGSRAFHDNSVCKLLRPPFPRMLGKKMSSRPPALFFPLPCISSRLLACMELASLCCE